MSNISEIPDLIKALINARGLFLTVKKNGWSYKFEEQYSLLEDIFIAVTPALCANKLAILQAFQGGLLVTYLYHESGQYVKSTYVLSSSEDRNKRALDINYGRRISICSILGIPADLDKEDSKAGY